MEAVWENITAGISSVLLDGNNDYNNNFTSKDIQIVHNEGLSEYLRAWFEDTTRSYIKNNIHPKVWRQFDLYDMNVSLAEQSLQAEAIISKTIKDLQLLTKGICKSIEVLNKFQLVDQYQCHQQWKSEVFLNHSELFYPVCRCFLSRSFEAYALLNVSKSEISKENDSESTEECIVLTEREAIKTMQTLVEIVEVLSQLDLLNRVFDLCWSSIAHKAIISHTNLFRGRFDEVFLPSLLSWVDSAVLGWVQHLLGNGVQRSQMHKQWQSRLQYFTYKTFADMRINEIFDIIVDYDNVDFQSKPALLDLKECLFHSDQRLQLIDHLKLQNKRRLLHRGADTSDIITNFQQIIAALRLLDPTEMMLKAVQGEVQSYLRSRPDTTRCVISSLINDEDEVMQGLLNDLPHERSEIDDDKWEPEPRFTCDHDFSEVSIYGSKESFVNDYHSILGEVLLSLPNYDTEKEIRNLELLKLRFGEEIFQKCTVMLEDIADSKRINSIIETQCMAKYDDFPFHSLILSKLFWPAINDDMFTPPLKVQKWMQTFNETYQKIKAARNLSYMSNFGKVTLELTFKDRSVDVSVSPFLASLILLFEEKERWHIDELASSLQVSLSIIKKRIPFWINEGVLKEVEESVFEIVEEQGEHGGQDQVLFLEDDGTTLTNDNQENEILERCWQFTTGMLTNLGPLTFERIHSMLSMCVGGTVPSQTRLKSFLQKKVSEGLLDLSGGEYKNVA